MKDETDDLLDAFRQLMPVKQKPVLTLAPPPPEGPDAAFNSGSWAITQEGRDFLDNKFRVPSALFLYGKGQKAVALLDPREYVGVHDAWKKVFVYSEVIEQGFVLKKRGEKA